MNYFLYIIDDSPDKLDCFKPILDKINENEAVEYINGFGKEFRRASYEYETIVKKIEESTPLNSYWIIDLLLGDLEHIEVAGKLRGRYFDEDDELDKLIEDFPEEIRDSIEFYLALVLMAILKKKKIPFSINSRAALSVPIVGEIGENYTLINYPSNHKKKEHITKVANQIIGDIRKKSRHPISVFIEDLAQADCHAEDRQNFICFEYLAKLLQFESKESFFDAFHLMDQKKNYRSPNIFAEAMKCFSSRGEYGLSMVGLILICWAAYRAIASSREEFSDRSFVTVLEKLNAPLMSQGTADKTNHNEAMDLARYRPLLPKQDPRLFEQTLQALYDMIQPLYTHEKTKKNNLQHLELHDNTFHLFLSIKDNGNLIQTLNSVHHRLVNAIDEGLFIQEHTTSMRILRYWLLSNLSREQLSTSQSLTHRYSRSFWGNKSHFAIENRKGKGITIKFTL